MILAIDGKSGSGKSTLAQRLSTAFGGSVFHMDDFFLRPEQRTGERLAQIGGNVDYERFSRVLLELGEGRDVVYQPYDCKRQCLSEPVFVPYRHFTIVEGSYSQHPYFGDCYDFRLVLTVDDGEQIRRIRERSGEEMLRRFIKEWIPKENAYLKKFQICEKADFVCRVL